MQPLYIMAHVLLSNYSDLVLLCFYSRKIWTEVWGYIWGKYMHLSLLLMAPFVYFFFYSQSFPACSWLNDTYTLLTSILIMFESFKLSMQPNSSWFLFTIGPLTCYFYFIIWCQDILKRANAKVAQAIFFMLTNPL